MNNDFSNLPAQSRRDFLAKSAMAAFGFSIVPRHVLGGPGYLAPSEQLTKAVIGVGGMGQGHLSLGGTKLLAICDVDAGRVANTLKKCGPDVKGYADFREVLARPDIDIIHVPTPPHWHALITIAAAEAGKDIWCEKPLSRTIREGEKVVDAVNRNGRVLRINTWFRFEGRFYGSGTTAAELKKVVDSGVLGGPLKINLGAATGFNWKMNWSGRTDLKPEPIPEGFDYDMWLGPAPWKPYNRHRTHSTFRGYWDYDGGGLGDMSQHYVDPIQYVIGKDDESPVEIIPDTDPQHHDAVLPWRMVTLRYADGTEIIFDMKSKGKVPLLEGPNGKVFKNMESTIPNLRREIARVPDAEPRITDFKESVRTRQKFALNETNGHRSCTLVNLAKIALRLGRPLKFNPDTQRFVNDDEANRMVDQPMRGPWSL